ncbi:MAG: PilZ domain-containing protein [Deltaproteobacteria bacterium]|nr:PilZ domain-containing protein [Deltaproteobacteria bacterium]MBI3754885.1 PilZ domain-containing protein [Deltaproteobacteria bacterium]
MANGDKKDKQGYVLLRPDRRKNLRNQLLVLNVKVNSENKSFFGYAKVISRGGMFIASVNPKNVGDEFVIEFSLPDKTPARCKCCVVWRREFIPRSSHEPGMGIKFLDLAEEIRDKIEEWVKKG